MLTSEKPSLAGHRALSMLAMAFNPPCALHGSELLEGKELRPWMF